MSTKEQREQRKFERVTNALAAEDTMTDDTREAERARMCQILEDIRYALWLTFGPLRQIDAIHLHIATALRDLRVQRHYERSKA